MPTYEYECLKCKKNFEIVQSMKDNAFTVCPKTSCRMKTWGKGKVKRLLGAGAGFIFKGSGFYITDYRSEGYKSSAKKETESGKASTETKSDAKSDSTKKEAPKTPTPKKEAKTLKAD